METKLIWWRLKFSIFRKWSTWALMQGWSHHLGHQTTRKSKNTIIISLSFLHPIKKSNKKTNNHVCKKKKKVRWMGIRSPRWYRNWYHHCLWYDPGQFKSSSAQTELLLRMRLNKKKKKEKKNVMRDHRPQQSVRGKKKMRCLFINYAESRVRYLVVDLSRPFLDQVWYKYLEDVRCSMRPLFPFFFASIDFLFPFSYFWEIFFWPLLYLCSLILFSFFLLFFVKYFSSSFKYIINKLTIYI